MHLIAIVGMLVAAAGASVSMIRAEQVRRQAVPVRVKVRRPQDR